MMKRTEFESIFQSLCQKYGIELFLNDKSVQRDNGFAVENEVHLGTKYKNNHIYMAIAFHEFAHALIYNKRESGIKRYNVNCDFMEEWFAWSLAMRFYGKYIGKPFTKAMGNFVITCLKSHSKSHYAFKNTLVDDLM